MNKRNARAVYSNGIALVMSLVILVVLTMLGVAMLNSSNLQEKMSGNQKRIAESSMAAEAAIQAHVSWLVPDPDANWGKTDWPNQTTQIYGYSAGDSDVLGRLIAESWDARNSPGTACNNGVTDCTLTVRGESVGGNEVLAQTRLIANFSFIPGETPLGGNKDIWTDKSVTINGNAYFTNTYLHSNGTVEEGTEVSISGGKTTLIDSRITANGTTDIKLDPKTDLDRCDPCSITGTLGKDMPPPDILDRVEGWFNEAQNPGTITFSKVDETGRYVPDESDITVSNVVTVGDASGLVASCDTAPKYTLTDADLSSGKVIYVNGNVEVSGGTASSYANLTVISTCDMIVSGAMKQTGGTAGEVNNVFYSGGDMTFNGAKNSDSPFEGRFFAGGDMTQNGRANIAGQIILNGDLRLNGTFNFTGVGSLGGNADTSIGTGRVKLRDWAQVW